MNRLKSSLLIGFLLLWSLFSGWKGSSLKDIARPYLGVYECESATLGERECLEDFSYIRLELLPENEFTLSYQLKMGKKGEEQGKYEYIKERKTLVLSLDCKEQFKREFPLEKGSFVVTLPVGTKTLVMKFTQKK